MVSNAARGPARRLARRLLVTGIVTAVVVGLLLPAYQQVFADSSCARPPEPAERAEQEAFVAAHLPDARGFEWEVRDCDEDGQAYLDFTTGQTGRVAIRAFLDDPACTPATEPETSFGDITCRSGSSVVAVLSFNDTGAIDTYGQLYWPPP